MIEAQHLEALIFGYNHVFLFFGIIKNNIITDTIVSSFSIEDIIHCDGFSAQLNQMRFEIHTVFIEQEFHLTISLLNS